MMSLWPKMDLKKEAEVKDLLSCLPQFLKADVGTCQAEFENTVRLYKIVLFSKKKCRRQHLQVLLFTKDIMSKLLEVL
jgi:hypothetical protein